MNLLEQILRERKLQGISWEKLSEGLPLEGASLRIAFSRKKVDPYYLEVLAEKLKIVQSEQMVREGDPDYNTNGDEVSVNHIPEGKIINTSEMPSKEVLIIPIKGRGGLEQAYYDDLALNKLEVEKLNLKKPSSNGSKWFKIEVEGVSMDDSTSDFEGSKYSLAEGDWAYCRSISKIHWRNKLHFNSVKVFCFFHNTRGIIFKKVKSHNIETGELELTSLNKNKRKFPDFVINVAECSYICNVIKVLSEF